MGGMSCHRQRRQGSKQSANSTMSRRSGQHHFHRMVSPEVSDMIDKLATELGVARDFNGPGSIVETELGVATARDFNGPGAIVETDTEVPVVIVGQAFKHPKVIETIETANV